MKKLILLIFITSFTTIVFGQTTPLNGVTFGFGAGYSYAFDQIYDYSLSTDGKNNLEIQPLNKGAFIISSVVMVKLSQLSYNENPSSNQHAFISTKNNQGASFADKLSINMALNLVDISQNATFNKSVNGGLGVGYFFNDSIQLSLFYDVSQIRQLRDYVFDAYNNKPIPNGANTYYNALDSSNDALFYNKTISDISCKLVYSIGNKKAVTTK